MASYKPTEGMKEEAQRGLDWRREYGRGGTEVGIARARDIVNGKNLSESTVKRMYSFFRRHEVDHEAEGFRPNEDGYPSNGRIAHALWGGTPADTWSTAIVERLKKEDEERNITNNLPNKEAKDMTDLRENTEEIIEAPAEEAERHVVAVEETEETVTVVFEKEPEAEAEEPRGYDAEEVAEEEMERMLTEGVQKRAIEISEKSIDEKTRRVRIAVSSEEPVRRSFGDEILDHSEESIDLSFLNSGRAPLLDGHDPNRQIGVVESVSLDTDRRLRAVVRFSRNGLGKEVFEDVVDVKGVHCRKSHFVWNKFLTDAAR